MSDKDTTPVSGGEPDTGRSVPAAGAPAGASGVDEGAIDAATKAMTDAGATGESIGRSVFRRVLRRGRPSSADGDETGASAGSGGASARRRGRLGLADGGEAGTSAGSGTPAARRRGRLGSADSAADSTRSAARWRGRAGTGPGTTAVVPADEAATVATSIGRLADADIESGERKQLLGRIAAELRARGVADTFKPRNAMRWVADAVGDIVPHLPIRRLDVLRQHFPALSDDEIAERLVRNAARATAAVGAAGGGIAAVEWVATPSLLTAPVLLATETVAVVAIEIKLIGELHELYGEPVPGTPAQRTVSLLTSWSQRRGVNPLVPGVGVAAVLGTAARKELRDRLLRRFGRNITSYGPLLTGAAVASYLNRRATIALAGNIRADLRDRRRKVIEAG